MHGLATAEFLGAPWPEVVTAIGTVLAFTLALAFGLDAQSLLFKPRLTVTHESRLPDCVLVETQTAFASVSEAYYCRFRVTNGRRFCTSATDVQVLLQRLWLITDHAAEPVQPFLPLNLEWADVVVGPLTPERQVLAPIIQPEVFRYCSLCRVDRRTANRLEFTALPTVNAMEGQLPTHKSPGTYEVDAVVTGSNYSPRFVSFRIAFAKTLWPDDANLDGLLHVDVVYSGKKLPTHPIRP